MWLCAYAIWIELWTSTGMSWACQSAPGMAPRSLSSVCVRTPHMSSPCFGLSEDAPGPEPNRVGMYHMAWEMASFEDIQQLHSRLLEHHVTITGYSDRQSNVMFL